MKIEPHEKIMFLSDMHIPFHSPSSIEAMLRFAREFDPMRIYLLGDIIDFYAVSRFDKDPTRITGLQDEIDQTIAILSQIVQDAPGSTIVYLEGNHEVRLQKYLWKHPEISSLNALNIKNLLGLDELGIKYIPQTTTHVYHKFVIEHGDVARKYSGYTARAQLEKRGMSGISGHTHRLGMHYHTNMGGNYVWVENGCMCDLNPGYVIGLPDWMDGFSVGYFKRGRTGRFIIEQVPIIDGKISYAGKEY